MYKDTIPENVEVEAQRSELDGMLTRLKNEDPTDELLKKIKVEYLDWGSYDALSYYLRLEDDGFPEDEVDRFKKKLENLKDGYGKGEVNQYSLLQYLENKINKLI